MVNTSGVYEAIRDYYSESSAYDEEYYISKLDFQLELSDITDSNWE